MHISTVNISQTMTDREGHYYGRKHFACQLCYRNGVSPNILTFLLFFCLWKFCYITNLSKQINIALNIKAVNTVTQPIMWQSHLYGALQQSTGCSWQLGHCSNLQTVVDKVQNVVDKLWHCNSLQNAVNKLWNCNLVCLLL